MGATITFSSDFSSFEQALERAQVKLKAFGLEPGKVERSLTRIGDAFSGQRIIAEAKLSARAIESLGDSGGLSAGLLKLTTEELQRAGTQARAASDKMKALGLEVPPNIERLAKSLEPIPKQLTLTERAAGLAKSTFGQMFSAFSAANLVDKAVSSIISFGTEAFNSASRVVDLSAKLNVSTDAIQRWDFVAKQTGSTMEDFASSAFKLGTKLAGGSGSVQQAVKDLGLSFQQLRTLKPEDQFDVVVTKLGEMQDATKRNALGVALFGRGFESIASSVAQDYGKIAKAASLSTNEQLVALDNAGDEWDKLKDRVGKATQGMIASVLKFSNEALKGILFEGNKKPTGDISGLLDPRLTPSTVPPLPEDYVAKLKEARAALAALNPETRKQIDAALELGVKLEDLAAQYGVDVDILGLYKTAIKDTTKETKDAAAEALKAKEAQEKWDASYRNLTTTFGKWIQVGNDANKVTKSAIELYQAMPSAITSIGVGFETTLIPLVSWNTIVEKQPLDLKQFVNALYALAPAVKSVGVELEHVEKKLGGFLAGFKGGFKDLWKGMSGGEGMSGFFSKMGTGISEGFGNLISGGISSLISSGLSLVTQGVGALWSKFTKSEGKKVNDLRDAAFAAAGGFEELNQKAHLAGTSLDRVLSTSKVKDYEAAWADLNKQLDAFTAEQEADQARLQAAMEKYKFTIEELGPALQKQELDKQAKDLIEDWRVLVSAGVDIVTVNEHMAKTVGDYLATAIKVGAEVPAAMKPILQSMIDQGVLVDASGMKIGSLEASGVKFSETMTEGFDRVVKKLDELIQKLQAAGTAISDIPTTIDISTNYRPGTAPDHFRGPDELPAFASGTRGRFLDFKSGTPVMLHGRERVMTESESAGTGALDSIASALDGIDRRISTAVSRAVTDALILAPGWR